MNIGANDITLSKKQFVFEHVADNIRDDYLIGKVLGTGILAPYNSNSLNIRRFR